MVNEKLIESKPHQGYRSGCTAKPIIQVQVPTNADLDSYYFKNKLL
jgi:hypothetical protein